MHYNVPVMFTLKLHHLLGIDLEEVEAFREALLSITVAEQKVDTAVAPFAADRPQRRG